MFRSLNPLAWEVGGGVRDQITGDLVDDHDFAIERTTEEQFREVFPDIKTVPKISNKGAALTFSVEGNDTALCREEQSTGTGDKDFTVQHGVGILDDLKRRDFTMNSIAKHFVTGDILDPHHGVEDIKNKLIRTVFDKAFIEDANRIARGCRFAAQFPDFTIEENTQRLMREAREEFALVHPERIEKELRKVFARAKNPSIFFRTLDEIGLLDVHFPELEAAKHRLAGKPEWHPEGSVFNHLMISFDTAKATGCSFEVGIAALLHDFGKLGTPENELPSHKMHETRVEILEAFLARNKFTGHAQKLATVVFRRHMGVHLLEEMKPTKKVRFVRHIPRHMREEFLQACNCDAPLGEKQVELFHKVCQAIDTTPIAIPKVTMDKGNDAIKQFVEVAITKTLKTLL